MRTLLHMLPAEPSRLRHAAPMILVLIISLLGLIYCEGPTGAQGPPGAANITVEKFSIAPEDTMDIQINGLFGFYDFEMEAITSAVVDSGVVLGYLGNQNQTAWTSLPYDIDIDGNSDFVVDYTLSVGYEYSEGWFSVTYIGSADTLFRSSLPLGPFKVAVFPPSRVGQLGKAESMAFQTDQTGRKN